MNIPLNIDWQQILLHWLNLAILIGGLYFLLYKPVKAFMDKRQDEYRRQDEAAAEKLREAEEAKAACAARLQGAEDEAKAARQTALDAAQAAAEAEIAAAQAQAADIVAKAQTEAAHQREMAIRESQRELKELVAKAAEKLVFEPDSDPLEQFLTQAEGGEGHDHPG